MGIIRAATPVPIPVPGLKVDVYGASAAMPIGISRDRKTIYGAALGANAALQQSTDDTTTWTTVTTFPQAVTAVLETDDGEALAFCGTATPGSVYKSTGWATSHTTATWALVLAMPGGFAKPWSVHAWTFGDDQIRPGTSRFGVIAEYGAQVSSSGDQTAKGRRLWTTNDYGATWALALDLVARYPGISPLHWHAVGYDPRWDRIWATYGDTVTAEPGDNLVLYSDDRAATWQSVDANGGYNYVGAQSTALAIFDSCVVIGGDNRGGYARYPRKGYRKIGPLAMVGGLTGGSGNQILVNHIHQNRRQAGAPALGVHESASNEAYAGIVASLDGGDSFVLLWEDPALLAGNKGVFRVFGPTYNGKVVAHVKVSGNDIGSGTHHLLRGELVVPERGLLDGQGTVTGDGTTTVFNFPHGLPATPSRYMAWHEKVAGVYAVTATATNIVLTFTAAPANATTIPFQWRAAA